MTCRRHDVIIIGAGQAGLSLSYYLTAASIDHVILEQGRVGNAWWEDRWDSFCLVTPNWSITLPGAEYKGTNPHGFLSRTGICRHIKDWAEGFGAPVHEGIQATRVTADGDWFVVETDRGRLQARRVVIATATYQTPRIPTFASDLLPGLQQIPAARYRKPADLDPGAVLVVGSGQSGCQIAEELNTAGREVYLSVSKVGRLPRRYRGQDCIAWQRDIGLLDRTTAMLDHPADRFRPDPHLSGTRNGHTLSLHTLRADGITLLGRIADVTDRRAAVAPDLMANIAYADDYAARFRRDVDAHIAATHGDAPMPTDQEMVGEPLPGRPIQHEFTHLDFAERNIRTVIWATGFGFNFSWIAFPVCDSAGYPATRMGVTSVPGLYFMGLNWMSKRKSGILFGVAEDAARLARRISADWGRTFLP